MAQIENAERVQYLSFSLRGTEYAVRILKVKEILQWESTTRVPSTPRSVRGVINLRGQVVPVVDLAAKFGLGETEPSRLTCILIVEALLEGAPAVIGVMADSVQEVIELGQDDVEPTPAFGTQVKVDFLLGVGKIGKRFVLLIDLDRVISADEKEFAREVAAAPAAEPEAGAAPAQEPPAAQEPAAPEAAAKVAAEPAAGA
jgi:purine-binding chemotaxis protein CheW